MTKIKDLDILSDARTKIDTIDRQMHQLIKDRAKIIAQVRKAKHLEDGVEPPLPACRPDREASMMRNFKSRHEPPFPFRSIEHIWREIIGAFTQTEQKYRIHLSSDSIALYDLARFHYGFACPFNLCTLGSEAIEHVIHNPLDHAIVEVKSGPESSCWWQKLAAKSAPKIFAKAPFFPDTYFFDDLPDYLCNDLTAFCIGHAPRQSTGKDRTVLLGSTEDIRHFHKLNLNPKPESFYEENDPTDSNLSIFSISGFHAPEDEILAPATFVGHYALP